ncbi:MAG: hypothetical protein PHN72_01755 [Bacilli bacterium]|nr:hypothetical protein [Bacilli bacterium]
MEIVEIIVILLSTIPMTKVVQIMSYTTLLKDLADLGYKILPTQIAEDIMQEAKVPTQRKRNIRMWIPGLNLAHEFINRIKYNADRPFLLQHAKEIDRVLPLSSEEEKRYQKNPSRITSILITNDQNKKRYKWMMFYEGNEKSEIWFTEENEKIKIVKVTGPFVHKPILEQYVIVKERLEKSKITENDSKQIEKMENAQSDIQNRYSKKQELQKESQNLKKRKQASLEQENQTHIKIAKLKKPTSKFDE